jgi:potassium efflux system protein
MSRAKSGRHPPCLIIALALCVCCGLQAPPIGGRAYAGKEGVVEPAAARQQLERIEGELGKRSFSAEELGERERLVKSALDDNEQCLSDAQDELDSLNQSLAILGAAADGEPRDIALQRKSFLERKEALDARLAECRLLLLKAEELSTRIAAEKRELFASSLLASKGMLLDRLWDAESDLVAALDAKPLLDSVTTVASSLTSTRPSLVLVVFLFATALGVGLVYVFRKRSAVRSGDSILHRLSQAFLATIAWYVLPIVFFCTASLMLWAASGATFPLPYEVALCFGVAAFLFLVAVLRTVFAPHSPGEQLTPLEKKTAFSLMRRLRLLLFLFSVGALSVLSPFFNDLPASLQDLAHALFLLFLAPALLWMIWPLSRIAGLATAGRVLRLLGIAVCFCGLTAGVFGYLDFAAFLVEGFAGTSLGVLLFITARAVLRGLFDGMAYGKHAWQRDLRRRIGVGEGEVITSLVWLKLFSVLFLGVVLAVFFLRIWGVPDTFSSAVVSYLVHGVQIGGVRIAPSRIFTGIVVFIILWNLSSWFKDNLDRKWLTKAQMGVSARETLVTISGYVVFTVAAIIGLSVAGVDFSNLALIAGALSVGIGFGLQNIVNNFVSGLILLLERPIKRGDWIVVGDTEGYVKRISVRSTMIETFDRADVIVPNSELISTQVTNWMFEDVKGRVRIPVGVAYGSNTALVRDVLLKVAASNPEVLVDGTVSKPFVLFMGFGESSLDFELRTFIRNIDNRLTVRSELLFAIDAAFRENHIEIPFPQRDVHVRDWPRPSPMPPAVETGRGQPNPAG